MNATKTGALALAYFQKPVLGTENERVATADLRALVAEAGDLTAQRDRAEAALARHREALAALSAEVAHYLRPAGQPGSAYARLAAAQAKAVAVIEGRPS